MEAAFGQSHNAGYGGGAAPADNRAHEVATYDAERRTLNVCYGWENWQTANGATTLRAAGPC